MRKFLRASLLLMVIFTVAYAVAAVYANANSDHWGIVYGAYKYESETPPTDWYTPEQLGIVKIIELDNFTLHVVVDRQKQPFPFQGKQPIFLYKGKFYQVSKLWIEPGLPEHLKNWQIPIGAVLAGGWVLSGALLLKERKE